VNAQTGQIVKKGNAAMDSDSQRLLNAAAMALEKAKADPDQAEYWTSLAKDWTKLGETHGSGGTDYCQACPDDQPWPCCPVLKAQRQINGLVGSMA
jgi:hypothetical protein